ncbi:MAG: hypothetical protein AB7V32_10005 [Candidatus Berkiella sp.]
MLIGPRSKTFIVGLAIGTGAGYVLRSSQTVNSLNSQLGSVNQTTQNQQSAYNYQEYRKLQFPRK